MSDFFSSGWSWFIASVTVGALVFCLWLLLTSSKTTLMSADGSTGHVWDDDLREMNNPLPRWWLGLFVLTVLFAAVYLYLYPGLGSAPGALKWSQAGQLAAEQAQPEPSLSLSMPSTLPWTQRNWPKSPRPWPWRSACSSTTARSAMALMPKAARAFPT
jgi:N-terminal domain of cytochrome oxidase-cbb3, FixP